MFFKHHPTRNSKKKLKMSDLDDILKETLYHVYNDAHVPVLTRTSWLVSLAQEFKKAGRHNEPEVAAQFASGFEYVYSIHKKNI